MSIFCHRMEQFKDMKYDLEMTRQWAIQAEKELYEMRARALDAEEKLKKLEYNDMQTKIDEMTKATDDLQKGVQYWYKCHMNTVAELTQAKDKIEEDNQVIAQLIQERNALYETLG